MFITFYSFFFLIESSPQSYGIDSILFLICIGEIWKQIHKFLVQGHIVTEWQIPYASSDIWFQSPASEHYSRWTGGEWQMKNDNNDLGVKKYHCPSLEFHVGIFWMPSTFSSSYCMLSIIYLRIWGIFVIAVFCKCHHFCFLGHIFLILLLSVNF